jgi:biotin-dependent carboxylase-like uncharacterized protein
MGDPSVRVLRPGLLTVVQDAGRPGFEALGIPRGGALDLYAYVWANRLAGNEQNAAILEATLLGPAVEISRGSRVATTGASEVLLNGRLQPTWASFWAPEGAMVSVQQIAGARAYLAFRGGIAVEPVLGSRSTNLEAGFGGHEGRALRLGDVLPIGESPALDERSTIARHTAPPVQWSPIEVRVVLGPRQDAFPEEAVSLLLASPFRVSPQSNHMGLRLDGPRVPAPSRGTRISEPMPVGGVQITPDGQPIVLLNGRGTIGGYPLLATVVSTDLWRLGQARLGDQIRFQAVSAGEAQAIARAAHADLMDGRAIEIRPGGPGG